MRCLSCKYPLKHLAEHRCPECGREFDPKDLRSFAPGSTDPWPQWVWFLICIAIVAAAYGLALWFVQLTG